MNYSELLLIRITILQIIVILYTCYIIFRNDMHKMTENHRVFNPILEFSLISDCVATKYSSNIGTP